MKQIYTLLLVLVFSAAGCSVAARDRATVYTEEGLEAAEIVWHAEYERRLAACAARYAPKTPQAEQCFGPTYDADMHVYMAVRAAVSVLRAYWTARASGSSPSWAVVAQQIAQILGDLPPDVRQYFERVKGLK